MVDSTFRAFVWRRTRRLPGDARAPDALPAWWFEDSETTPTAIVTGAGSGIGYATAERLLELGARVVVVCATLEEAEKTKSRMIESSSVDRASRVVPAGVDLRNGDEIDSFVTSLDDRVSIRCVVHCAGVMRCSRGERTKSGLEETAAVNAVAPKRLTAKLVARRERARKESSEKNSERMRVVYVGSFVHRAVRIGEMRRWLEEIDRAAGRRRDASRPEKTNRRNLFESQKNAEAYVPAFYYACSKMAVTVHAYDEARRFARTETSASTEQGGVSFVLFDPGIVDTNINRDWPRALRFVYVSVARFLRVLSTPRRAAEGVVRACFAKVSEGETVCAYLYGVCGAPLAPSALVRDEDLRRETRDALERWARK